MASVSEIGKSQSLRTHLQKYKWLYILLLPGLVYLLIFKYVPMYGVIIAFKDFRLTRGIWKSEWIGLDNFRYLFTSKTFFLVFKNSIILSLLRLFCGFPAPLILALLLNELKFQGYKRFMQSILYLPHFISWVVLAGIIINFLSPGRGVVSHIMSLFGQEPKAYLLSSDHFRGILILSGIWKEAGWGTILYLAALSGIDEALYEAAVIDGVNRFQRIWYITLPGLAGVVVILLILSMGGALRNGFEQIFMLYSPMVYNVADVFETYTFRVGLMEGRFSYGTSVGLFQSFVGMILILITNAIARRLGEKGLW